MWKWLSTKGGVTRHPAASISLRAAGVDRRRQLLYATVLNRDVAAPPAIRQVGVANDEVQHQRASLRKGLSRAAGASALRDTSAIPTMVSTNGSIRKT